MYTRPTDDLGGVLELVAAVRSARDLLGELGVDGGLVEAARHGQLVAAAQAGETRRALDRREHTLRSNEGHRRGRLARGAPCGATGARLPCPAVLAGGQEVAEGLHPVLEDLAVALEGALAPAQRARVDLGDEVLQDEPVEVVLAAQGLQAGRHLGLRQRRVLRHEAGERVVPGLPPVRVEGAGDDGREEEVVGLAVGEVAGERPVRPVVHVRLLVRLFRGAGVVGDGGEVARVGGPAAELIQLVEGGIRLDHFEGVHHAYPPDAGCVVAPADDGQEGDLLAPEAQLAQDAVRHVDLEHVAVVEVLEDASGAERQRV
ncbi:acetate/butyrate--CoA ligase AAE7 [Babesia caballi]|uniref:Acetate/butyrate--CoA ligase AAE7 n=1 Tax=Babesia caballi TaxID=5871 RepID=A0AAV4M047_BABCB|nr:acetate/butyrate--CoA ligase AAE7 [Babesia caballi]